MSKALAVYAVAALAVAGAIAGGTWTVQDWRWEAKLARLERDGIQSAWDADKDHRNQERNWAEQLAKAQENARINQAKLAGDVGRLRTERDGLRDDLSTLRAVLPQMAGDALRRYAAAATDVFELCTGRYSNLAETADGHAGDALMLTQAWPAAVPAVDPTSP